MLATVSLIGLSFSYAAPTWAARAIHQGEESSSGAHSHSGQRFKEFKAREAEYDSAIQDARNAVKKTQEKQKGLQGLLDVHKQTQEALVEGYNEGLSQVNKMKKTFPAHVFYEKFCATSSNHKILEVMENFRVSPGEGAAQYGQIAEWGSRLDDIKELGKHWAWIANRAALPCNERDKEKEEGSMRYFLRWHNYKGIDMRVPRRTVTLLTYLGFDRESPDTATAGEYTFLTSIDDYRSDQYLVMSQSGSLIQSNLVRAMSMAEDMETYTRGRVEETTKEKETAKQNAAALTIQATVRGYKTRKELQKKRAFLEEVGKKTPFRGTRGKVHGADAKPDITDPSAGGVADASVE